MVLYKHRRMGIFLCHWSFLVPQGTWGRGCSSVDMLGENRDKEFAQKITLDLSLKGM